MFSPLNILEIMIESGQINILYLNPKVGYREFWSGLVVTRVSINLECCIRVLINLENSQQSATIE